jgi:hypothetical protein
MIEFGPLPLIHGVTGFAGDGKIRRNVIQRRRLLEVALMAANARSAQPYEHARGRATVAVIAL